MDSTRYSRQTNLPEIGQPGQSRLTNARVLCVGVGGLGCPSSLYLAAAGVGTLGLIDPDRVDFTNLQRQILFQDSDQGIEKVLAAKYRLGALNPQIKITTYAEALTAQNALSIFSNYDVIIDGSDNFDTKFLINDSAYKADLPWVYGSVNRFEGQVALLHGRSGPCYRCLFPTEPQAKIRNCAENGVLGSIVGTIGTLQATLALQILISQRNPQHSLFPKAGELTLFDLLGRWQISTVQISKNPACPTCSRPAESIELQSKTMECANVMSISPKTLAEILTAPPPQLVLLDVRETSEWDEGHIKGALHWPLDRLENGQLPIQKSEGKQIIIYCKSGARSARAAQIFLAAGVNNIHSLTGGFDSWQNTVI